MNVEQIHAMCKKFTAVTESIKWDNDVVFSIGTKMFCVVGLDQSPNTASFKVQEEQFEEMCDKEGFKPAPYLAKWAWMDDISKLSISEWEKYIKQSYELVKEKLTPKIKKELGLNQQHVAT